MQTSEEDEDRDEEEGALAAFGCLRALSTVLESVSSLPHLFPALEPIVFPVLQRMCTQEGQDVYEEIMEILSYFTYFSPEVTSPPRVSFASCVHRQASLHSACFATTLPERGDGAPSQELLSISGKWPCLCSESFFHIVPRGRMSVRSSLRL